jgi:signal transduction histidine kinase
MTSIRRQLTIGLLAGSGLLLAASGALVWLVVREVLLRQFDASLRSRAVLIQSRIEEEDGQLEVEMPVQAIGPSGQGIMPTLFQVWTTGGVSALKSENLGAGGLPRLVLPPGETLLEPSEHVLADGTRVRAVAGRFDAADDKRGQFRDLTMVTARSMEGIENTLQLLSGVLAGTGVATLLLMVPVIRLVLGRGLRPLHELAARTAAIDSKQLHERLPEADNPEELQPVARRLNELLARLEASFERERRFSSDVAHELRTPVAELKALGEVATSWPDQATPEAFGQVLAIAGEMEEVISRLTLLARAEAGNQPVAIEDTSVDELLADAISRFSDRASERGLRFGQRLEPVRQRTDPALLRMILTNLVGNAVYHAPDGSLIEVALDPTALSIRNQAPGLGPDDLPRLLERFWRKDETRTGYGHSGLGLSLVHSLAGLIGCVLEPSLSDAGVLQMRLRFARPEVAFHPFRFPG